MADQDLTSSGTPIFASVTVGSETIKPGSAIRYLALTIYGPGEACATGIKIVEIPIGDTAMTISTIHADVTDAGTTGTMVVDVNINGTTTMSTSKVVVQSAATADDDTAALTTTALSARDVISVDVDSVHSGTPANGLVVLMELKD